MESWQSQHRLNRHERTFGIYSEVLRESCTPVESAVRQAQAFPNLRRHGAPHRLLGSAGIVRALIVGLRPDQSAGTHVNQARRNPEPFVQLLNRPLNGSEEHTSELQS